MFSEKWREMLPVIPPAIPTLFFIEMILFCRKFDNLLEIFRRSFVVFLLTKISKI